MCVPSHLRDKRTRWMMVLGNFSLAAAVLSLNLTRHYAAAHPHASASLDGITGLFFGLSIGVNLFVVARARRCRAAAPIN